MTNMLRNIPSVSEVLESPPLKSLVNRVSGNVVVTRVRRFLDDMRAQVQTAAAVGAGGQVIVARGELMESDDGFRLHEAIGAGGAIVLEVGSVNRTCGEDYSAAITPRSAAILRASAGSYAVVGSQEATPLA